MKHIFYHSTLIALCLFFLSACTNEVEDTFSKSSSERIDEAIKADKTLLTSAKNGWVMQYYAATKYGGYNVLCKFNADNTVTVASEVVDAARTATSHYSLSQSQGVVLSFDEYNEIFHFFSNPVNEAGIGDDGEGMLGDFEFRVLSASADSIVLRGKKHQSRVVMTPLADNVVWEDYINNITAVEDSMLYKYYGLLVGNDTVSVRMSYRTLNFTDPDTGNDVSLPYIVTDKGFRLYQPTEYKGKTITGFNYSEENCWENPADKSVSLLPIIKPLSQQIKDGEWFFSKSGMSAQFKKNFNYAMRGCENLGETIYVMYLGEDRNGNWGFNFWSGVDVNSLYAGSFYYKVTVIDDNTIRLNFADDCDDNAYYYYMYADFQYVLMCLGANGGFNYTLTTDDIRHPSWIKLTNVDRSGYTVTLTSEVTYFPFDN